MSWLLYITRSRDMTVWGIWNPKHLHLYSFHSCVGVLAYLHDCNDLSHSSRNFTLSLKLNFPSKNASISLHSCTYSCPFIPLIFLYSYTSICLFRNMNVLQYSYVSIIYFCFFISLIHTYVYWDLPLPYSCTSIAIFMYMYSHGWPLRNASIKKHMLEKPAKMAGKWPRFGGPLPRGQDGSLRELGGMALHQCR